MPAPRSTSTWSYCSGERGEARGEARGFFSRQAGEGAGARAAGQNVEADFRTCAAIHLANRVFEFDPARDNRGEIRFGSDAELHVDVGEPEVTVNQQGAAAHLGEAGGEGGGEPGLPDPALARGDRNDGSRRHARALLAFGPFFRDPKFIITRLP
jgi:hypothetical protein